MGLQGLAKDNWAVLTEFPVIHSTKKSCVFSLFNGKMGPKCIFGRSTGIFLNFNFVPRYQL